MCETPALQLERPRRRTCALDYSQHTTPRAALLEHKGNPPPGGLSGGDGKPPFVKNTAQIYYMRRITCAAREQTRHKDALNVHSGAHKQLQPSQAMKLSTAVAAHSLVYCMDICEMPFPTL